MVLHWSILMDCQRHSQRHFWRHLQFMFLEDAVLHVQMETFAVLETVNAAEIKQFN